VISANRIISIAQDNNDGNVIVGTGSCFAGFIVILFFVISGGILILNLSTLVLSQFTTFPRYVL
jgi:hypothetical protein